jgi:hypothetical protein
MSKQQELQQLTELESKQLLKAGSEIATAAKIIRQLQRATSNCLGSEKVAESK